MTAIKVPPLGESIVEATVSRWLKNEGDAIAPGDTLVELETDKITVEVPAMTAGVLTKRAHAEGDVVKVDDLLAEIDETASAAPPRPPTQQAAPQAASQASRQAAPQASAKAATPAQAPRTPSATSEAPTATAASDAPDSVKEAAATAAAADAAPRESSEVRASPAAHRVAAERGIDLAGVVGTGRGGVISKPDVIERGERGESRSGDGRGERQPAVDVTRPPQAQAAPTPTGTRETREKLTTRRKRMAEHLLESQHATAHLTTFNEIDMSAVIAVRERLKERVEKAHGTKLSFMPFFVKAACLALKAYPVVNAQMDGDAIVYKHYVNMGIAVASDAGLVVPNIKDADRKGMLDISRDIVTLAKRARDGKLTMDDLTGGTFTITNGGVFGSLVSTPILNYPQVGILGLHKTQDRPVAVNGKVEIRPMMYIALSYDHRVIDGQQAVLFLVRVKELMEDPASMLIE